jgi:abortive infection alpha-like protein
MEKEMPVEYLPALAKAATEPGLFKEIYGDLLKPGVSQVGKALANVMGLGNTILWPVQLLNERSKVSLEANMERYREKLANTPIEEICPVAPEIGVPVAEKLSYVSDRELSELYTTLLARASSTHTQPTVHPSFVNVLNNLSPDEAQILLYFQRSGGNTPFIGARLHDNPNDSFNQLVDTHFSLDAEAKIIFPQNVQAYASNLEGLGLIRIRTDVRLAAHEPYAKLEQELRERYKALTEPPTNKHITIQQGKMEITRFGWLFLAAAANG